MPETIDDELLFVTCTHCGQVASLSYGSLMHSANPPCPSCGEPLAIDKDQAEQDALRKSEELDAGHDGLGSHE